MLHRFLSDCCPEDRAIEPEYPRYRDTHLPHVGVHIWVSGNAQKIGSSGKNITLCAFANIVEDDLRDDPENLEHLAKEVVVNGVGPHAFYSQFETEMHLFESTSYQHSTIDVVQTVVFLSSTRELCQYLSQYNIFRPIVRMSNFYVLTGNPQRRSAWSVMQPFFACVDSYISDTHS